MSGTMRALPAPEEERRKRGLVLVLLRSFLLLLPLAIMVVLLLRAVSAENMKVTVGSRTFFQFMLQGPQPQGGGGASTTAHAAFPWPARTVEPFRLFADEDIPPEVVEQAMRQQGLAFTWVQHPRLADLSLGGGNGMPGRKLVEVSGDGRVTLPDSTKKPEELANTLADNVWQPANSTPGVSYALGVLPFYGRLEAQAVRETKERNQGKGRVRYRPAPVQRWAPISQLVADPPVARLVPALQTILRGEPCQLDFQLLGHDGEWYSVTDRTETRFRIRSDSESLIPYGTSKGSFLAPVDSLFRTTTQRLVVEAVLDGPGGLGLGAEAVVIVAPTREW